APRGTAEPRRALREGAERLDQAAPHRSAQVPVVAHEGRGHEDPQRNREHARRPATRAIALPNTEGDPVDAHPTPARRQPRALRITSIGAQLMKRLIWGLGADPARAVAPS